MQHRLSSPPFITAFHRRLSSPPFIAAFHRLSPWCCCVRPQALGKAFGAGAIEQLDEDNQYKCEKCGELVNAEKGTEIKKAAYVQVSRGLQLQPLRRVPTAAVSQHVYVQAVMITRADYDWETDAQVKVHDRMSFPFTLDMAPYMAAESTEPEALEASGETIPRPCSQSHGPSLVCVFIAFRLRVPTASLR